MASPHFAEWLAAAKKEHQSLLDLKVFELHFPDNVLPGYNIISSRWAFKANWTGDSKLESSRRGGVNGAATTEGAPSRRSDKSRASGFYLPSL